MTQTQQKLSFGTSKLQKENFKNGNKKFSTLKSFSKSKTVFSRTRRHTTPIRV